MKKVRIITFLLLTATFSYAQVPQGIKYQAVVRDNNGIPVENKSISLRISLLEDSATGQAGYVETHSTSTNALGLVNLTIGTGGSVLNDMDDLQWGLHEYFAKVEVDTSGGTNYVLYGTSKLLTVPYAFHSVSGDVRVMTTLEIEKIKNKYPGMMVFNSDSNIIVVFNGHSWHKSDGKKLWICGDTLTDLRDGKKYPTVRIGSQCWMARNLNIGTRINSTADAAINPIIEKYCYNDLEASCDVYGGLYQWDEMMDYSTKASVQGICPPQWHIPADTEWKILEGAVDSKFDVGDSVWDGTGGRGFDAGANLKEVGLAHWNSPNPASNSSGFAALPGGYRDNYGNFLSEGNLGYWWSSSDYSPTDAWRRFLYYYYQNVNRYFNYRTYGYSVRCVRD